MPVMFVLSPLFGQAHLQKTKRLKDSFLETWFGAMALQTLAFVLAFVPLATGHGYQKYISEYAGDYLKQFGKGSGYQDYIQTYAGMKSDAPKEAQAVSLMAADTSKGHTKKEDAAHMLRGVHH